MKGVPPLHIHHGFIFFHWSRVRVLKQISQSLFMRMNSVTEHQESNKEEFLPFNRQEQIFSSTCLTTARSYSHFTV